MTLVSVSNLASLVAVLLSADVAYGILYRIYLSPIAHVPGPLFARLTFWNEFYYDVVLGGKYTFVIKEYHDNPVVRIDPYEVHILDSHFYEQLYLGPGKGKVDKWYWAMRMFGRYNHSAFDTLDHDLHRMRREPWNPTVSTSFVTDSPNIKLLEKPVTMIYAYACLTADVISEYSFPKGYGFLDWYSGYKFNSEHYDSWMAISKINLSFKQFGWLFPLLNLLPLWYVKLTSIETYRVMCEQQALGVQAKSIAARLDRDNSSDFKERIGGPSMLETFMTSTALPLHEKTWERIRGEAHIAMAAGTLTSTHALKTATYHILANPHILSRLLTDLETSFPDFHTNPPDLRKLESVEYLMAILYETLRIFYGVSHRLQRIYPDRPSVYGKGTRNEVVIPPGTPVGMTAVHVHDDETIFPNHRAFDPERWWPLQTNGVRLQTYLKICSRMMRFR